MTEPITENLVIRNAEFAQFLKEKLAPLCKKENSDCIVFENQCGEAEYDEEKLKEIDSVEESAIPIESQLMALAAWMKRNYGGTMQQALKMVLPVKRKAPQREKKELVLSAEPEMAGIHLAEFERKHYHAKVRLLSELMKEKRIPQEFVTGKLHVASPTIRSLEKDGLLRV